MTRILLAIGISCAHHVIRNHAWIVARVTAILKAHNRYLDFLQQARRLTILVQRTPAGRDCLRSDILLIWNPLTRPVCTREKRNVHRVEKKKRKRRLRWNAPISIGMHRVFKIILHFTTCHRWFIHLLTSHLDLATLLEYTNYLIIR